MAYVSSFGELEELIGKERLRGAIESEISCRFPIKRDGEAVFEADWDWSGVDGLEEQAAGILANQCVWFSPSTGSWHFEWNPKSPRREAIEREARGRSLTEGELDEIARADMDYRRQLEEIRFSELEASDSIISVVLDILERDAERSWAWQWRDEFYENLVADIETQIGKIAGDEGVGDLSSGIPTDGWIDYLYDNYGVVWDTGISSRIGDLRLRANIGFCIGDEWNREYTNIACAARDVLADKIEGDGEVSFDDLERELLENNSLTWLLATQGESWASYVEQLDGWGGDGFLKSVETELANTVYDVNELTLCAEMRLEDYARLMAGEQSFRVDTGPGCFTMGLFDPLHGAGSAMELSPHKPFVIGEGVIGNMTCECRRAGKDLPRYSVDSVYGFVGEIWSIRLSPTPEKPLSVAQASIDYAVLGNAIEARREALRHEEAHGSRERAVPTPASDRQELASAGGPAVGAHPRDAAKGAR